MSTTESDSEHEHEPTDSLSSLTAFARLSTARPSQGSVSWAVDTLATLDFRLVRKDAALHGLIHDCASTILALFDDVLHQHSSADTFIPDIASILRPSFLHLLFQYRRLFRVIAARELNPNATPLAIICWVDLVLAKLGDVIAYIAAGLNDDHPDRSLPESLAVQREEDNLRAAIQLPDNLDMLPSMLSSQRASVAARRLSIRLMLGRYILCPALTGQMGVDTTIQNLLSTFAEFVRQSAVRLDALRALDLQYLLQQERLTSAMVISLFAAADMARASTTNLECVVAFRPQTMAAAMQLLRFVLNEEGYPTQSNILSPMDRLDIPTSVIIRWGIVPQWTWSIWLEHRSLYADTITRLTTVYIQHQEASSGALLEISDLMSSDEGRPSSQVAIISVMIDLLFRFISVLSAAGHSKQLSTGMMGVLCGSCRLISQWINGNACGIQNSMECCKALIVLFGYTSISQDEQHLVLNALVIECLAYMTGECTRDAWKAAVEDNKICFPAVLGQSFIQIKAALSSSHDELKASEMCAVQLMQFLAVVMSKGVQPSDLDALVGFIEAVGERILELPQDGSRSFLCAAFFTCLASAKLSETDLPFSKVGVGADEEVIWRLGMCSGNADLFLASAFSVYISSGLVSVDPLTYLEGLEHLVDVALLICSQHYPRELGPLGLVVLPTICDAVAHLLGHRDDTTGVDVSANMRLSALGSVMRSLANEDDSTRDTFGSVLKRRLSLTALFQKDMDGMRREYELMMCRLEGYCHMVYVV